MDRLTRRQVLQRAAALSAASLLPRLPASAAVGADYDVVVIGAGIAGMIAARDLSRAGPGLKVLLLEAQDRVGGRLLTLYDDEQGLPSHGVEVGAQMIHGSNAATWELIREFELQTRPLAEDLAVKPLWPSRESRVPDAEMLDPIFASIDRAFSAHAGGDLPFSEFVEGLWLEPADRELVYSESLSWSAEPDRISTRALLQDSLAWEEYHDGDFQILGGHGALVEKLAADLEGRIQTQSEVTQLFWSKGLAGVGYRYQGVETSLTCRQLIVTLPVGVLQGGSISVNPALPDTHLRAINAMEMGNVVVVPMLFSEPFWQDSFAGPGAWTSPAGRYQFWVPHSAGKGGHAVQGWFEGRAATELSALGPEAGLARVIRMLEEASGAKDLIEKLHWHHIEDWSGNPYSRGSYSFTRPGGAVLRQALAEPVGKTLYFAGEATAPAPHFQTVHGAYMSGKRAARQVMDTLKIEGGATSEYTEDTPIFDPL